MDDWTKLFDSLLLNVAAYPVTIWNLLFHPLVVFQQVNGERRCAASLTYLFTIFVFYVYWHVASFLKNVKPPDWLTPKNVIGFAVVYVAIIVNVQQYAVSRLIAIANVSVKYQLEALVYAFCPVLLLTMVVGAAGWLKLTSKGLYPTSLSLQIVYLWCLYNVGSAALRLSPGAALRSAFVAWVCFFGIALALSLFLWFSGLFTERPE
ncbi:MAG: hypothetical protein ACLQBK_11855 [Candidatus Sulfotelmatobacter sp.]